MTVTAQGIVAEHGAVIAAFIAAARSVPGEAWNGPLDGDRWSPAQIAEHLRLTYRLVGGELRGMPGLRIRTPVWLRPWLRFRFLRSILKTGVMPAGARAPREVRPPAGPFDREATLTGLAEAAAEFERNLLARWDDRGAVATHHVFGALDRDQILRFAVVHAEHHRRQLGRR